MSVNAIKMLAFDLDGTLIDSIPDLAIAANHVAVEMGYAPVSVDDVRQYVGNGADVLIGRVLSRSLTVDSSVEKLVKDKGRTLFDQYYEATGHQHSRLYDGVSETLQALSEQGFIMAVVTNKPSKFVPEILKRYQIDHLFQHVIGGDDFEKRKPDPMALNWLMTQHGISSREMMMIGDSKNDVLAAKNAGCASFALTYGYNHGEPISASEPDFVADSLTELLEVVMK